MKSGTVMGGFVSALMYHVVGSSTISDVPSVAIPVLESSVSCDHFGPTGRHGNRFVLVPSKNGAK